ncbi:hypothetical protein IC230_27610 [Spirosoma sp. BT704]|uniref:Alpha/beta fold hydrolase n=2 Tax=Spirosoma validum TaxID=2771355 RepID=A0A927B6N7_9BACT|nr:hypothetical protein [Spirosoma validum]
MTNAEKSTDSLAFEHQQVAVEGVSIHTVTIGQPEKPVVLFLHGYPENWQAFKDVMVGLSQEYYAVAIDLPGIG